MNLFYKDTSLERSILLVALMLSSLIAGAQFAPPAGEEGSTAIHSDSSIFVDWAKECDVNRGFINIADADLGFATYGSNEDATGVADNMVVSLGDGGEAVLYFEHPVINGPGWDFAVFENSFDDTFLELAFVEVSSDGENYFRFPSVSLTQTDEQVDGFGTIDTKKINNLAGKYKVKYGTPFDLDELKNESGLDVNNIIAVRIIDVVGSVLDEFARYDSEGHKINDPWPTPFESSGFDLDAVGVINNTVNNGVGEYNLSNVKIFPNPCYNVLNVKGEMEKVIIRNISGNILAEFKDTEVLDISGVGVGLLIVEVVEKSGDRLYFKILKK